MRTTCTVDAELFDSLQDAVDFVAERGGGLVYTDLAGTLIAKTVLLPETVEVVPARADRSDAEAEGPGPAPPAAA